MGQVPDEYVGLWRRERIVQPDGARDVTTEVYWLQSHALYVDLRIPQPRPNFSGYQSLEQMPAWLREWLQTQEGFAGTLEVKGEHCQWHRTIDYQPPGPFEDEGRALFASPRVLIETGIHVAYEELWRKPAPARGAVCALRVRPETAHRDGILVVVGGHFMYAIGRRPDASAIPPLPGAGDWRIDQLDCEIGYGRASGIDPWRIERCSLPFREGAYLLPGGQGLPAEGDCWTPPPDSLLHKAGAEWQVLEHTPVHGR